jgi:predicted transcriptional regulator
MGLDLARSRELLEAAGIAVGDDKEMIQEIAKRSGKTPQQIYDIIKAAGFQPTAGSGVSDLSGEADEAAGPDAAAEHVAGGTSEGVKAPKSGMGKKTIAQLCDEIGEDCTMIIEELKKRGMKVDPELKLKDLATENDTGPMQIYETIVEIVNEKKGQ